MGRDIVAEVARAEARGRLEAIHGGMASFANDPPRVVGEIDRHMARSAIAALREPTPEMVAAGEAAPGGLKEKYQAMIDKALSQQADDAGELVSGLLNRL